MAKVANAASSVIFFSPSLALSYHTQNEMRLHGEHLVVCMFFLGLWGFFDLTFHSIQHKRESLASARRSSATANSFWSSAFKDFYKSCSIWGSLNAEAEGSRQEHIEKHLKVTKYE